MLAPLATAGIEGLAADRPTGIGLGAAAARRGARHVAGIKGVAAAAQARQPACRAPVPSTVKLAILATAFSRDSCMPTTADLAGRVDAMVVAP